jgi:DNA repair protein RadD
MSIIFRDYQEAAVSSIFQYFKKKTGNPIVALPTGCHAKGQHILMFSGHLKKVEDIEVGDLLMGPDSTARTVLQLCRGNQEMRKIIPNNGSPWIVNKDHILALYKSKERSYPKYENQDSGYINETVSTYETSSKWHQHIHKLYRVPVEFPGNEQLSVDPYFLGLFLGDGSYSHSQVSVTSMDQEILDYCEKYYVGLGDKVRYTTNGSKASSIYATTKIKGGSRSTIAKLLKDLGFEGCLSNRKFIPYAYRVAKKEDRLALLAGLIDTDGHLSSGGYEYCTVSKALKEDVEFIARSLGFAVETRFNQNVYQGYFRLFISGEISNIPVLLQRKKGAVRRQKKNVLITGFRVEPLAESDYYGFTLDKDNLYLLGDFTVTHNTGKSLVLSGFIQQACIKYPGTRIMKLTHVKELIAQNHNALLSIWPNAPAGIFSAGLNKKQIGSPIIFGGIGSVAKVDPVAFGRIDLLIIDECHLVSPKQSTQYQLVIDGLRKVNPYLKVVGFTATHYRLGQGMLTDEGGIFTDTCFDMTRLDAFNWLLDHGYLSQLIPKKTSIELDVSNVHLSGGEYKQQELQEAVDKEEITYVAVQELVREGWDRSHWLVFASGIEHTIHVAEMLESFGVATVYVHSKMTNQERDAAINGFKAGTFRAMVNNGILTTGFDFPAIDLIGVLRPTQSASLWVQMLGRGTRPVFAPGFDLSTVAGRLAAIEAGPKRNCKVLDFAGNTRRLGPINDPVLPKQRGKGKSGMAPVKICEACGTYNHASVRFCIGCGFEFPKLPTKINAHAGSEELISRGKKDEELILEIFKVDRVTYHRHTKPGKPDSLQVSYFSGLRMFREWICLEHQSLPGKRARDWWRERSSQEPPETIVEALEKLRELRVPSHIRVWMKTKYNEVLAYDFSGTAFGESK